MCAEAKHLKQRDAKYGRIEQPHAKLLMIGKNPQQIVMCVNICIQDIFLLRCNGLRVIYLVVNVNSFNIILYKYHEQSIKVFTNRAW